MATKEILATYSPEDVTVILANDKFSHIMTGYTEGTFLSITRLVPASVLTTGADATNARTVRSVKNCDITCTLMQTSETNDVLSQLLVLDEASRDGSDCFSLTIKDNSGRTLMSSPQAFIGTVPDIDFGIEIMDRPWMISAIHLTQHIGGNGRLTPEGFDTLNDLGYAAEPRWTPASA